MGLFFEALHRTGEFQPARVIMFFAQALPNPILDFVVGLPLSELPGRQGKRLAEGEAFPIRELV